MHQYRITVEAIAEAESGSVHFVATNHDDLLAILGRVTTRFGLSEDETKAMIVGLKLLSEVVLKHRVDEPFTQLRPALRDFTLHLKQAGSTIVSADPGARLTLPK